MALAVCSFTAQLAKFLDVGLFSLSTPLYPLRQAQRQHIQRRTRHLRIELHCPDQDMNGIPVLVVSRCVMQWRMSGLQKHPIFLLLPDIAQALQLMGRSIGTALLAPGAAMGGLE